MSPNRTSLAVDQPDRGVIPLAKEADPRQVEALIPLLGERACVIVGSAPMASKYAEIHPGELALPVNGGISSVKGSVDLWIVGSKHYDVSEAMTRPLHRTMLDQAKRRVVSRALFLRGPKHASEQLTLQRLHARDCRIERYSVLDKPTKRWLEGELCGRIYDKAPCSSGILAAAVALWCGAATVRLMGFSLKPGYHYLPNRPGESWWRDHVDADRRALRTLRHRFHSKIHGDIFTGIAA